MPLYAVNAEEALLKCYYMINTNAGSKPDSKACHANCNRTVNFSKSASFANPPELTNTRRVMDPILGVRLLNKLIKETDKE